LRDGVLRQGDIIGTATTFGKIKILEDFRGIWKNKDFRRF